MTMNDIREYPMPERAQHRVTEILTDLSTGPKPPKRCNHVKNQEVAYTCAFDYVEIGLLCADCIQAHIIMDDLGFAGCDPCWTEDGNPHILAVVDSWVPALVPPRSESDLETQTPFYVGHVTIVNAIMMCQKHADKLVAEGHL